VEQRWLVVESEELKAKVLWKLQKKLRSLEEELGKKLNETEAKEVRLRSGRPEGRRGVRRRAHLSSTERS
jgi:hypothetical protein